APEGPRDVDQLDRLHLRLDARPLPSGQARRQRGAGKVRGDARKGLRRDGRGRLYDERPRAAGRAGAEVAVDHRLPRQGRREFEEGDGGGVSKSLAPTVIARTPSVARGTKQSTIVGQRRLLGLLRLRLAMTESEKRS